MWFNSSNISSIFWSWVPVPKRRYRSSGKEKESRCLEFTSATKREISHFHVLVVQWRQRNAQKCVMHVEGCCFANLAYCFLPFSLTSLSSLLKVPKLPGDAGENVALKVSARSFNLYRDYFNSLTLSNASDLFWTPLSTNYPKSVRKGNKILLWYLHDLHKTWN